MRITLVIPSLGGGGAERVMSTLADAWARHAAEVTLLSFDDADAPAYAIHPSVKLRRLALLGESKNSVEGLFRNLRRIRLLRRAIQDSQPAMVVSFMERTNILTLLATRGLGVPVVISERTDPSRYPIGRIWGTLRRFLYPHADALVCQTSASLARFQRVIKVRGAAIPNPVVLPSGFKRRHGQPGEPRGQVLTAMGRLVPQKGFDILLKAFSSIAGRHPCWSLQILGKGPLRNELEEQAKALEVAERVHFLGEVADPFSILSTADLFVFSSRFEGFGMALAEAMACGLTVVSFDCPEGPADIIRDGVDGVLVPPEDVDALAEALDRLMGNAQERARLAARAPEVLDRFSPERILAMWQQLFDELLSSRG